MKEIQECHGSKHGICDGILRASFCHSERAHAGFRFFCSDTDLVSTQPSPIWLPYSGMMIDRSSITEDAVFPFFFVSIAATYLRRLIHWRMAQTGLLPRMQD
jgi:hypothetical protein